MTPEQLERRLADLVSAAESMAEKLAAFGVEGLTAVALDGEPIFEWSEAGGAGYGTGVVARWRRLLDDARREGVVPP